MDILTDILYTNKKIIKNSFKGLIDNWPIIFTGLFYSFATLLLYMVAPAFGILGGLLSVIVTSALISNYLYLLNRIVKNNRFSFHDFKDGFSIYLRKIWTIFFFGYVASLGLRYFILPILPIGIYPIISLLTVIVLNALPESIYQKYYDPWETITYAVEFIKENVIEWVVPNIILIGVMYITTGNLLTNIFNYYISIFTIFTSPSGIVFYLIGQLWFSYMMIYRGFLFELLSTSTRRKRLFMREF
ncbi:hypothetical protein [Serpentinicella alkaliphila]|uniref:Uncharacterized protein n=1 Tax=Serpentinicella alkaliphila TaxID=1734049 RepID=A0A4R2TLX5_9FIRM|nr:hypothetical protein [Serpentinicella alkaliphila]QUH24390.1 hypothetical protein HZR23_00315 [Serpentinicella alkaliphila]TCP98348.1 hypothetical protein EDD79_10434 [Serpentinicella alkaliphila]